MSYLLQFSGDAPSGTGGGWRKIALVFNATATPIPVSPGIVLWNPTAAGFVRGLTANQDSVSPLVPNGGATQLAIGITGTAPNMFVVFTGLAAYGTLLLGWGEGGPQIGGSLIGAGDSGVAVAPAGGIPGQAALARQVRGYSNAGTITGLLHLRFEFRPFASGGF